MGRPTTMVRESAPRQVEFREVDELDGAAPDAHRRVPPWLVAVLAAAAVASIVLLLTLPADSTLYWGLLGNLVDVHVYRWGGEYVRAGLPLYGADLHALQIDDQARGPMPFTYTPFAAVLFVPLSLVSVQTMGWLWTSTSLLATWAVARAVWIRLGYGRGRRTSWVAALCAAVFLYTEPMRMTLWLGQINMVILLLVVWDATLPEGRDRQGAGVFTAGSRLSALRGAATGVAAGIKLTPAFLWAHLAVTRRWRAAVVSVATFVLTVAVGLVASPGPSRHYWSGGLLEAGRVGAVDAPSNQSVNGVLAWYVFHGAPPVWAWLAGALPAAAVGLAAAAFLHRRGLEMLALCVSGMTGCMVSPFSWGHHWVWFLPLLVVVLDLLLRYARRGVAVLAWLLPVALLALVGAWPQDFPDPAQPDGRWVATGWFMSRQALDGPLAWILREPYVAVWASTVVLGVLFAARRGHRVVPGSGRPAERL